MGGYLNIPNTVTTSPPPPPASSLPQPKPNPPMLYYGLVVVGTAAIVLAVYNLIIVRWCATQYHRRLQQQTQLSRTRQNGNNQSHNLMSPPSRGGSTAWLVSSFKYKKGGDGSNKNQVDNDGDCSVCLSVFEEGEEVRKLPRCGHSFHASCIDMWLHSHIDCPLCRTPVVEPPPSPTHD